MDTEDADSEPSQYGDLLLYAQWMRKRRVREQPSNKLEEIKQGDIVEICRHEFCAVAAVELLERFGESCEAWGLIGDMGGTEHYFLIREGTALDIGGFMSPEALQAIFSGPVREKRRVPKRQLYIMANEQAPTDELREALAARITQRIDAHPDRFVRQ
ncbi:MAG: hypothetical protein V4773_25610 [Verrucomicrobiota bacterium]